MDRRSVLTRSWRRLKPRPTMLSTATHRKEILIVIGGQGYLYVGPEHPRILEMERALAEGRYKIIGHEA